MLDNTELATTGWIIVGREEAAEMLSNAPEAEVLVTAIRHGAVVLIVHVSGVQFLGTAEDVIEHAQTWRP